MPRPLILTALRDFLRRPWQSALMIVGVALGVAVVIAIDLANASASRAFELSTEAVTGRTTHQIVGSSAGIPQELFRQVRVDWNIRTSAPVVEGVGIAPGLEEQPVRLLGIDPSSETAFRDTLGGSATRSDLGAFYTTPNGALIGPGLAAQGGLEPGDSLTLTLPTGEATLAIVGILRPGDGESSSAYDDLALMDVGQAQALLGLGDRLTRIDLILTDAEATSLAERLPAGVRLVSASTQRESTQELTAAFQLNLTALSLLALVVGMFLIYNTIMFSVVQRRQVLGILRQLGVTEPQMASMILLEALLVALTGGMLGVALGWLLGQGAVRLVTQTINDLYFVVSVRDTTLEPLTALKGLGAGVLASLLAAAGPAYEAATVPPITMAQRSTFETRAARLIGPLAWVGVALTAIGAIALLAIKALLVSLGAMFVIVIGLALMVPALTQLLLRVLTRPLAATGGAIGRLAPRTVTSAISRTSVAIAALMVAVSVTIGVAVMISSFRSTLINWLELTLVADLYVTTPSVGGGASTSAALPDGVVEAVGALPDVASIATIRTVQVEGDVGRVNILVADSQERRSVALYRTASGAPEAVWSALQDGSVMVTEPFANRYGVSVGDSVTLQTDRGSHGFPVAAVYYDYGTESGRVLMSRAVYESYFDDRAISGVAVYAKPGVSLEALAADVRRALAGEALQVSINRELRDSALTVFDRTFAITDALRLLAVVVAFIGVLSALMALQLERARELATLRALGLTDGQLWRLSLLETGLMGLAAGLFALPTGAILAVVLVYVINLRSFGWTLELFWDPWVFAQAVVVSVLAAVLAAIEPMRRLLRQPIAAALRQE